MQSRQLVCQWPAATCCERRSLSQADALHCAVWQMLKAFSPVIVLFLLFSSRLEKPTFMLSSAILVISFATFQSASGEVLFSWTGLFLMLASELFDSIKLVLQQVTSSCLHASLHSAFASLHAMVLTNCSVGAHGRSEVFSVRRIVLHGANSDIL